MNDNPLWLPKGSIRAVMALMIVGAAVYLAITGTLKPSEYIPIVSMVLGFYFGYKKGQADKTE